MDHLTGEENPTRLLIELGLLVLLLHGVLIAYLKREPVPETPAEPLVMAVELLAAPAPPAAKPAPPAPPAVPPKPRPKPVKPKKAPAPPKKAPPAVRPPVPAPAPTPAPAAPADTAAPAPASAPAAAPSSASAGPSAPAQATSFTEANYRANYKSNPKPEYPRLAKSRGWQGKVLLRVEVSADGRSLAVAVQQSSGHKQLDDAAVEAVRRWTFIPAKRGTTPVASTVTVPIQFKLND
jgi:protein TonB